MVDPSAIFQPEHLLPEQWHGARRQRSGELRLALAVLEDALTIIFRRVRAVAPKPIDERERSEAERWLASNDERSPFSFLSVCALVGYDPEWIRRGIRDVRASGRPINPADWKRRPRRARSGQAHLDVDGVGKGPARLGDEGHAGPAREDG